MVVVGENRRKKWLELTKLNFRTSKSSKSEGLVWVKPQQWAKIFDFLKSKQRKAVGKFENVRIRGNFASRIFHFLKTYNLLEHIEWWLIPGGGEKVGFNEYVF